MLLKKIISTSTVILMVFALAACEQEGPAERAGEKIDEALEDTAEKIEETGEAIKAKAEEAKEDVKEATQ